MPRLPVSIPLTHRKELGQRLPADEVGSAGDGEAGIFGEQFSRKARLAIINQTSRPSHQRFTGELCR